MDRIDERELKKLLEGYSVSPPSDELLESTRTMMHRHLAARREEMCVEAAVSRAPAERPMGLVSERAGAGPADLLQPVLCRHGGYGAQDTAAQLGGCLPEP